MANEPAEIVIEHLGKAPRSRLVLSHLRVAFLAQRGTLVLADPHFGHHAAFRAVGVGMPSGVLDADLRRLSAAVERFTPRDILILGDVLHMKFAITPEVRETVHRWRSSFSGRVRTLIGNHDRGLEEIAASWNIEVIGPEFEEDGLRFDHYPTPVPDRFVLAGHEHPATAIGSAADGVRLPCFAFCEDVVILPAFSGMAAGTARGIPRGATLFAAGPTGVFEVPGGMRKVR
ncbi:MAG: ligase-associated DNA damage response endonuclease PdeM [Phycisphaerales bacterium]